MTVIIYIKQTPLILFRNSAKFVSVVNHGNTGKAGVSKIYLSPVEQAFIESDTVRLKKTKNNELVYLYGQFVSY